MISSTLGAPLGGTTRGGHQGVDCSALRSILPPNGSAAGGGSCLPSMVVVALGEPSSPVICGEASVFIFEEASVFIIVPVCCDAQAARITAVPAKAKTSSTKRTVDF